MAKRSGFSLVEVLLATMIGILVMGALVSSFIGSWNAQRSQEIYGELQRQSRLTVDEISKQAWNATSITGSVIIGGTTYTANANTLVLRLPPLDSNGDIITGDDYVVFALNEAKTERLVSPLGGSSRASWKTPLSLNQDTAALQFRYFNAAGNELIPGTNDLTTARTVRITVRSARTFGGRVYDREIETTVLLRNKAV